MHHYPLVREFMDTVADKGAEAILPQNLSAEWLDHLYVGAVDFLRIVSGVVESPEDGDIFEDESAMVLLAAVAEIIQEQRGHEAELDFAEGELFDRLSCYAISILFEYLSRKVRFVIETPDLSSIFDEERLIRIEAADPEITQVLNMLVGGACTKSSDECA